MREFKWRKDGMKQILDSPHKTWNKQAIALMTGNVIDNGYTSWYIRPWNQTECNGYTNEPGHLQNFDLNTFKNLPNYVREYFRSAPMPIILMEVFTYNKRQKMVHGYIAYTNNYDKEERKSSVNICHIFYTNNLQKSIELLTWIKNALIEEEEKSNG